MVIPVTFMSQREARAAQVACRAPGDAAPASSKRSVPVLLRLCQALLMFLPKRPGQGTGEPRPYNPINLGSIPHLCILQPNGDLLWVPPSVRFSILSLPFSLVGWH